MAQQVIVGNVAGAFGVKGWVKVFSHTDPPQNILNYSPWLLENQSGSKEYKVLTGKLHGHFVVAKLEGVDDREQAIRLRSSKILTARNKFPPPGEGQYYWADLVGLKVRNVDGVEFGTITDMMETGANDVIVVQGERERLIPFVLGQFVKDIDLAGGSMLVDWDSEF